MQPYGYQFVIYVCRQGLECMALSLSLLYHSYSHPLQPVLGFILHMALVKGVKIEKMYVLIFFFVYMFDEIKQMNTGTWMRKEMYTHLSLFQRIILNISLIFNETIFWAFFRVEASETTTQGLVRSGQVTAIVTCRYCYVAVLQVKYVYCCS